MTPLRKLLRVGRVGASPKFLRITKWEKETKASPPRSFLCSWGVSVLPQAVQLLCRPRPWLRSQTLCWPHPRQDTWLDLRPSADFTVREPRNMPHAGLLISNDLMAKFWEILAGVSIFKTLHCLWVVSRWEVGRKTGKEEQNGIREGS